jgi:hypothetical protein
MPLVITPTAGQTSALNTLPYFLFFVSYFLLKRFSHRKAAEVAEF